MEDPEIFVIDTGATTHSTRNEGGFIELKDAKGNQSKVRNGTTISTKAIETMSFKTMDGTDGSLSDVHLILGAPLNLVSSTKLLILGFELHGKGDQMVYTEDGNRIVFDVKINTPQDMMFEARLRITATVVAGAATVTQAKSVSIKTAHKQLKIQMKPPQAR